MGHANLANLSEFFVKHLYAKGKLSIRECTQAMVEKKIELRASEGGYEQDYMLALGLSDVVIFLIGLHDTCPAQKEKVIEPIDPTDEQKKLIQAWANGDAWAHEPDKDGFLEVDDIQWKFSKGWRRKYHEIPMLGRITH